MAWQYNWSEFVLNELLNGIRRFRKKTTSLTAMMRTCVIQLSKLDRGDGTITARVDVRARKEGAEEDQMERPSNFELRRKRSEDVSRIVYDQDEESSDGGSWHKESSRQDEGLVIDEEEEEHSHGGGRHMELRSKRRENRDRDNQPAGDEPSSGDGSNMDFHGDSVVMECTEDVIDTGIADRRRKEDCRG